MKLDEMKALVRNNDICVLATASASQPHCSLMVYAANNDCEKIYMVTRRNTAKYRNLLKNPLVSLLIDTREESVISDKLRVKALTVEGVFEQLIDEIELRWARAKLLDLHPGMKDLLNRTDAEIITLKVISFQLLEGIEKSYFESLKESIG